MILLHKHIGGLKQMIGGVVLDNQGQPICCQMWPGNTADVSSLLPVVAVTTQKG
jgi:hypothetical protein